MSKPLDGGIAKALAKALKQAKLSKAATLTRLAAGTRTTAAGGTHPTSIDYACRGFVDDYAAGLVDGTLITAQDRRVMLVARSLAVAPIVGDRITIESATYAVQRVTRDPATAMWTLQARGASS